MGWAAYRKLRKIFSSRIPQYRKTKGLDYCVLPAMGTMGLLRKFKVTQWAMEKAMLRVSLRDRTRN